MRFWSAEKSAGGVSSGRPRLSNLFQYTPEICIWHNAHGLIYVLEGSIVMQVKGGKEVTLTAGETFYEAPDDVHLVSRNASSTEPAKFIVFLVKDKGAPVLLPVTETATQRHKGGGHK